jgi:hypothetical protein
MMSQIRAGAAYVEVSLRDGLTKPLQAMASRMKQFGAGLAAVGASVGAIGATMTAPFIAGIRAFSDFGSAVFDMAKRTGMSAEGITVLKYAAEQTGTSISAVEAAVRKMSVTLGNAARGSKTAADALGAVGLAVEDLQGLSPDQQFRMVAKGLASIRDHAVRASAGAAIFGRSWSVIVPMVSDFAALEARARKLGLVMSDEAAAAADELGDSLQDLNDSMGGVLRAFGAAVSGPVTEFARSAAEQAASIGAWIAKNKELVVTIGAVGLAMTAIGAAVVAIGGSLAAVGVAVGGFAAAIAAIPAILSGLAAALPAIAIAGAAVAAVVVAVGTAFLAWKMPDWVSGFLDDVESKGGIVTQILFGIGRLLAMVYGAAAWVAGSLAGLMKGILSFLTDIFASVAGMTPPMIVLNSVIKLIKSSFEALSAEVSLAFASISASASLSADGIKSALAGGDVLQAVSIAWAGVKAAIISGLSGIVSAVASMIQEVLTVIGSAIPIAGRPIVELGDRMKEALDISGEVNAAIADLKRLSAEAKRKVERQRQQAQDEEVSATARAKAFGGKGESVRRIPLTTSSGGAKVPGMVNFALGLSGAILGAMEAIPRGIDNIKGAAEVAAESPEGFGSATQVVSPAPKTLQQDLSVLAAGAFAALGLPALLGAATGPEDKTAENTALTADRVEDGNRLLQKILDQGGLEFS